MKTIKRAAKMNSAQFENARMAAESGAEVGLDFALGLDDEETACEQIRAEARSRVAGTDMPEYERRAYISAFVAAAEEAIGL